MTRLFDHPFLLGFEAVEEALEQIGHSGQDGYPPYNIEQVGKDAFAITLAVAGFRREDLSVFVEKSRLVVRGKRGEESAGNGQEGQYLHRGIAMRQFERSFLLADGLKVEGAELKEGLLTVKLERPPLEERVRHVEVKEIAPAIEQAPVSKGGKTGSAALAEKAGS